MTTNIMTKFTFVLAAFFALHQQANAIPQTTPAPTKAATPGQFPYHADIFSNQDRVCGGALISTKHVLTAAQCVAGLSSFEVRLGMTVRSIGPYPDAKPASKPAAANQYQSFQCRQKIIHENFDPVTKSNDLAIVLLPSEARGAITIIDPAGMAMPDFDNGWPYGKFTGYLNSVGTKLHWANMTSIGHDSCQEKYGKDYVTDNKFCSIGLTPYFGDAGGPLTSIVNKAKNLVAIYSFDSKKFQPGYPMTFTRLIPYYEWIKKITRSAVFPTTTASPTRGPPGTTSTKPPIDMEASMLG